VANGGEVIRALFPNARITQVDRDPNSALGRANPNSWHNRSHAAVDVAPIHGMTFGQYVQRIQDDGYHIIEARDEATHPLAWTTGPNWHVVIGEGR
jgi:soluble lytic murein transglycosylase